MANFKDSPHFAVHDDYYTPESAWTRIKDIIPKHKLIWEACMLGADKSKSPDYILNALENGGMVYDTKMDCLTDQPLDWDLIITNIPFDKNKKIHICSTNEGYQNTHVNKNDTLCQSYSLLTFVGVNIWKHSSPKRHKQNQMKMGLNLM